MRKRSNYWLASSSSATTPTYFLIAGPLPQPPTLTILYRGRRTAPLYTWYFCKRFAPDLARDSHCSVNIVANTAAQATNAPSISAEPRQFLSYCSLRPLSRIRKLPILPQRHPLSHLAQPATPFLTLKKAELAISATW